MKKTTFFLFILIFLMTSQEGSAMGRKGNGETCHRNADCESGICLLRKCYSGMKNSPSTQEDKENSKSGGFVGKHQIHRHQHNMKLLGPPLEARKESDQQQLESIIIYNKEIAYVEDTVPDQQEINQLDKGLENLDVVNEVQDYSHLKRGSKELLSNHVEIKEANLMNLDYSDILSGNTKTVDESAWLNQQDNKLFPITNDDQLLNDYDSGDFQDNMGYVHEYNWKQHVAIINEEKRDKTSETAQSVKHTIEDMENLERSKKDLQLYSIPKMSAGYRKLSTKKKIFSVLEDDDSETILLPIKTVSKQNSRVGSRVKTSEYHSPKAAFRRGYTAREKSLTLNTEVQRKPKNQQNFHSQSASFRKGRTGKDEPLMWNPRVQKESHKKQSSHGQIIRRTSQYQAQRASFSRGHAGREEPLTLISEDNLRKKQRPSLQTASFQKGHTARDEPLMILSEAPKEPEEEGNSQRQKKHHSSHHPSQGASDLKSNTGAEDEPIITLHSEEPNESEPKVIIRPEHKHRKTTNSAHSDMSEEEVPRKEVQEEKEVEGGREVEERKVVELMKELQEEREVERKVPEEKVQKVIPATLFPKERRVVVPQPENAVFFSNTVKSMDQRAVMPEPENAGVSKAIKSLDRIQNAVQREKVLLKVGEEGANDADCDEDMPNFDLKDVLEVMSKNKKNCKTKKLKKKKKKVKKKKKKKKEKKKEGKKKKSSKTTEETPISTSEAPKESQEETVSTTLPADDEGPTEAEKKPETDDSIEIIPETFTEIVTLVVTQKVQAMLPDQSEASNAKHEGTGLLGKVGGALGQGSSFFKGKVSLPENHEKAEKKNDSRDEISTSTQRSGFRKGLAGGINVTGAPVYKLETIGNPVTDSDALTTSLDIPVLIETAIERTLKKLIATPSANVTPKPSTVSHTTNAPLILLVNGTPRDSTSENIASTSKEVKASEVISHSVTTTSEGTTVINVTSPHVEQDQVATCPPTQVEARQPNKTRTKPKRKGKFRRKPTKPSNEDLTESSTTVTEEEDDDSTEDTESRDEVRVRALEVLKAYRNSSEDDHPAPEDATEANASKDDGTSETGKSLDLTASGSCINEIKAIYNLTDTVKTNETTNQETTAEDSKTETSFIKNG